MPAEVVELCAVDTQLYSKTFFPKTVRQDFAPFDRQVDNFIEGPGIFKILKLFRGGAKTTKSRIFASKRIAYGISKNILVIGKSEGHAKRTIKWLKQHVRYNRKWKSTFGLSEGVPWTDTECEILQMLPGMDEPTRVHLIGMGITGSVRGINTDDWRPDLILLDDVLDEETAGTEDQRSKIEDLIFGAVEGSLAPQSEEPNAMILCLQTPLNREDFTMKAENSERTKVLTISILTQDGQSAWPSRWTTEQVLQKKLDYIKRNKLSVWNREYECKLTSPERCAFRGDWLRRWDVLPKYMSHVLVIDPVPPKTDLQLRKPGDAVTGDYEALGVTGNYGGKFYEREISVMRGHTPNWTVAEFFRLCTTYKVQYVIVETVGYQKTLSWLLREAMRLKGIYWPILEWDRKISKYHTITDGLSGPMSEGAFLIPPDDSPQGMHHSEGMRQFVEQVQGYPHDVSNDDALEVGAIGVGYCSGKFVLGDTQVEALDGLQQAEMEEDARARRRTAFGVREAVHVERCP